ncbi:radical SAM domain protein [Treponema primitia ZAS-2]|uniref:Radical SAM domain protein n=1 Tax=Treponema primitia (strain ATCC BAA-887 / DSM 12427 / ZAS-2) TaxID=545694 RepID=F5YLP0_TREPZ|nr:radical SAM protein [Treponema primitia]AEF86523.1 radical SAM domain protein [Treponema primitia ZAS-2]
MICLIQPPLVQLNSPYPAPYYLKSFLEKRGFQALVFDHSMGLFERIFCRAGLKKIFAAADGSADTVAGGKRYLQRRLQSASSPRSIIERFLSEQELWLSCIDRLGDFLRGRDREFGHLLALANGVLPGGPRFDACLDALDGNPSPDAAPLLATKLLEDMADFITVTLDSSFSLVRYSGQSGGAGFRDFTALEQGLDGYILGEFYRPLLEEQWDSLDTLIGSAGDRAGEPLVIGMTIPFPGCLAGALVCAASAKARYGDRVTTIAGGGYINTELRFMEEPRVFDYFDYLSFDRGYGSLAAILEHAGIGDRAEPGTVSGEALLYKTLYRPGDRILRGPGIADTSTSSVPADTARFEALDRDSVKTVFPDYAGIDFSRYLRPVDDANPMHRLWSDGHWLKAYLAHGCYWHSCAFCDVGLDYIRGFEPVDTDALFRHLKDQAEKTGVRGLHLVDEAAPAASLLRLALLNREAGLPLIFWGNIRFDRGFNSDTAAILAAGGLVGVSGGIEVATEGGFKRLRKGINMGDLVKTCAAFKEAGILTHAYLIYGYWDQSDKEIMDSAEILRQLFAAGLLDSAFWHKFVLTRHSRIYTEWERGLHPGLKVEGNKTDSIRNIFALNDLSFEGEENFDKFTEPLDRLLSSWMAGDAKEPPEFAFPPLRVPKPEVSPDTVEKLLDEYARSRDRDRAAVPGSPGTGQCGAGDRHTAVPADRAEQTLFLGSRPLIQAGKKNSPGNYPTKVGVANSTLRWRWRLEDRRLQTGTGKQAAAVQTLLEETARGEGLAVEDFYRRLEKILGTATEKAWKILRSSGLVVY